MADAHQRRNRQAKTILKSIQKVLLTLYRETESSTTDRVTRISMQCQSSDARVRKRALRLAVPVKPNPDQS